jgi:predicted esterase
MNGRSSQAHQADGGRHLVRSLQVTTHGRYLVATPSLPPRGLLLGFHGYAENAALQMDRLLAVPGADSWLCVSVQGLHRFYRGPARDIAASWMTREDRDLAIADNLAYVGSVIDAVAHEWPGPRRVAYAGFSQGVAMAFRAGCLGRHPASGLIALGGDVPPDLNATALRRLPRVLLGRGTRDTWYTTEGFEADQVRLQEAGVAMTPYTFDEGHVWTSDFAAAVGRFLDQIESARP